MHQSPAIVSRSPNTRSRITNRSEMLRGIAGRSAEARRYGDLIEGFVADFVVQKRGALELALIRQAAALTVQAEALQTKIVRGEDIDLEQLTRLTNVLTRTLKELGLKKRRADKPSLADYLKNGGAR